MFAGAIDKMSPSDDGHIIDITCCDYKTMMSEAPILSANHHYSSTLSGKDKGGVMENNIIADKNLNGGNAKNENFSYEANLSMLTMGAGVESGYNTSLNGGPAFNEGVEDKYDEGNMFGTSGSDYQFLDVTRKTGFSGKYAFDKAWLTSDIIPMGRLGESTYKSVNTHSHPKLRGIQSSIIELPDRYPYPKVENFKCVKGESTMIEFLRELDLSTQKGDTSQAKPTSVKTLDVRIVKAPMVYGATNVSDCVCNELYIFRLNDTRVPKTHKQTYESILDTNYNYDRLGSNYYDVAYATCGIEPYIDDEGVSQGYQEWTMSGRLNKVADNVYRSRYDIIPKTFITRVSAPDNIELEDGSVQEVDKLEFLKGELTNALSSTSSDLSLTVVLPSNVDGTYCLGDLIEVSIGDMDRDSELFYIKAYNYTINPQTSSGEWSYTIEKFTGGYL
jgi:hypothetical protein